MPLPSLSELERQVEKAGIQDDPKIQKLLSVYNKLEARKETRHIRRNKKAVASLIQKKVQNQKKYPFQENRQPFTYEPGVLLGTSYTGSPYHLPQEELNQHVLISGSTGSGKTNLIYQLVTGLETPYWIFDVKQDYRHLLKHEDELLVLPEQALKFNPLQPPPLVDRTDWADRFIKIFCDTTRLLSGSKTFLAPFVYETLEEQATPTLQDLKEVIESSRPPPGPKSQYHDRITSRLQALTTGPSAQIFQHNTGFDLEKLLHYPVVFELNNLDQHSRNLITGTLIEWVYQYRYTHQQRNTDLLHAFIVDESKSLYHRDKEQDAEEQSHIANLTDRIREFGESIIAADQSPSKLMESLITNTKTKILLPSYNHRQLEQITDSLNLNQPQQRFAENLDTGDAIVQVGNQQPSIIAVNEYQIQKTVDTDQIQSRIKDHPATSNQLSKPSSFDQQETGETPANTAARQESTGETGEKRVTDQELRFLEDIAANPFKPVSQRYKKFSSTGKGVQIKNQVLEKDLAQEVEINKGNASVKLFELTDSGRETVEKHGTSVEREGRGGIEHQYWQHQVKNQLEDLGWSAGIEKLDADVYAKKNGEETVFEVAMEAKQREIDHIEKHLEKSIDKVLVFGNGYETVDKLQEMAEQSIESKNVSFHNLQKITELESLI